MAATRVMPASGGPRLHHRRPGLEPEHAPEAARLSLLPDGALELINEAAWDACGAPAWEGEDPITLDAATIQEMRT